MRKMCTNNWIHIIYLTIVYKIAKKKSKFLAHSLKGQLNKCLRKIIKNIISDKFRYLFTFFIIGPEKASV